MSENKQEYIGKAIEIIEQELTELEARVKKVVEVFGLMRKELVGHDDLYDDKVDDWYVETISSIEDSIGPILYLALDIEKLSQAQGKDLNMLPPPQIQINTTAGGNHNEEGKEEQKQKEKWKITDAVASWWMNRNKQNLPQAPVHGDALEDLIKYGNQVLPSLVKVLKWHEYNIFHLHVYDTKEARWYFTETEKSYILRLSVIVTAFLKAAVLYIKQKDRKNITDIGKAQAQTLKEIFPTFIQGDRFAEGGIIAGPRGLGKTKQASG